MRDTVEVPHPLRQSCPGPGPGVAALLLLVFGLGLGGCIPGPACASSRECGTGHSCVRWEGGYETLTYCAKTCPVEADVCDDGQVCGCPDSPLKKRCFNEQDELVGVCGG